MNTESDDQERRAAIRARLRNFLQREGRPVPPSHKTFLRQQLSLTSTTLTLSSGFALLACAIAMILLSSSLPHGMSFWSDVALVAGIAQLLAGVAVIDREALRGSN